MAELLVGGTNAAQGVLHLAVLGQVPGAAVMRHGAFGGSQPPGEHQRRFGAAQREAIHLPAVIVGESS